MSEDVFNHVKIKSIRKVYGHQMFATDPGHLHKAMSKAKTIEGQRLLSHIFVLKRQTLPRSHWPDLESGLCHSNKGDTSLYQLSVHVDKWAFT